MSKKIIVLLVFTIILFVVIFACKEKPAEPVYDNPFDIISSNPVASFTINPSSGNTSTIFTFDASASSDNEDASTALEIRWDWENDETWDTGYSITKTANHQYASLGTKIVKLEVRDSDGLTNTTTQQVVVTTGNTAPTASFTVNPSGGNTSTIFTFDASASSDNEDASSALEVRWDWEDNGTWDTGYSTTKTENHQYSTEGIKTARLEVRDSGGLTSTTTRQLTVSTGNTPPTASFSVDPTSGPVNTFFNFDASSSSDNEDDLANLQVRWDWEDDGTWDIIYTSTKTAGHMFASDGVYTVRLEVRDSGGLSNATTREVTVSTPNTAPMARFSINPATGTTGTLFTFNPDASSDNEDILSSDLQMRWDWENDGTWDTGFTALDEVSYQYAEEGTYTIKLEVMDTGGLTDTISHEVTVSGFETGTVTDIDGNVYQTIKIGTQWWMAENLKVTRYRNGEAISNITSSGTWAGLSEGAYCTYNNDDGNTATYGFLYNGFAVTDNRNITPAGWHVPTDEEWKQLEIYLGMTAVQADGTVWRGTNQGGKLKSTGTTHWASPNTGATNSTGFSALPGGIRHYTNGGFDHLTNYGYWWSSNALNWRFLGAANEMAGRQNGDAKQYGFSVRCVMD
jgi:uncharacterized protein (TIGR02145 family)